MTARGQPPIPTATLRWLARAPDDRPVAVLFRHAERPALPPGAAGYRIPLTEAGAHSAVELGGHIGNRLRSVHASPLVRTMETGRALATGAGVEASVQPDRTLGDPGVYVTDDAVAGAEWERRGHAAMMACLVGRGAPLPGLAEPGVAARALVAHMLGTALDVIGIHAFVTHDSLVTATVAQVLGVPLGEADWPEYLEGAFFWGVEEEIGVGYRGWEGRRAAYWTDRSDDGASAAALDLGPG